MTTTWWDDQERARLAGAGDHKAALEIAEGEIVKLRREVERLEEKSKSVPAGVDVEYIEVPVVNEEALRLAIAMDKRLDEVKKAAAELMKVCAGKDE